MPALTVSDLSKRFDQIKAVDSATFDIKDKEYLCILGPTGSGKTTLLRLLAGILKPDDGVITLDGFRLNEVPAEDRNAVYVPQTYALFPHMTVAENVMFGRLAKGESRDDSYDEAVRILGLVRLEHREHSYPNELSGGMQQRVALARGLASGSKFLLLDEPLGALDARLRLEIRGELRHLAKRQGFTVVHVTHDQEEAMTIADRILILRKGQVQQYGTPFHVYQKPDNLFIANFVGSTSFFEGVITSRTRNGSTVRLREGLVVKIADTSYQPEEDIVIAIRDENIKFSQIENKKGARELNLLKAKVTEVHFLGRHIRFEARLSNGDSIASNMHSSRETTIHNIGDEIQTSFDPSHVMIFSYPTRGVLKELEVY